MTTIISVPSITGQAHEITAEQYRASAAHWRALADAQEAAAVYEQAHGLPRGDVAAYQYNATLYRQTAAQMEAEIKASAPTLFDLLETGRVAAD